MMVDIYNVSIVNCVQLIFLCICAFVNFYGSEIYLKVKVKYKDFFKTAFIKDK